MAQVPQLFGAPAPQDTGGPLSSLMSTQMRGAELAVQSAQQAVAQTAQALQFGMQLRARKDEQLREIEAQGTLERVRQQAADERARLEREQQDRQFRASQRLDRQRGMMDFRLRSKGLGEQIRSNQVAEGFQGRSFDAQVGHQDRMFGLQRMQVESGLGLDKLQMESLAETLRQNRQQHEQKQMADRQKALAYEFMGELFRELPDGTKEPQFERIMPLLQQLQGTPYNAETQDEARDPNAAANIGSELERMAGPRNERAMKRTDQGTDMMRVAAAGRGGEAPLPAATGPQRVNPASIEAVVKAAPGLGLAGGAASMLASQGRLVFDADTGTFGVLGGAADPETMLALKRLEDTVRDNPTLGFGLAGAGAFPGAPGSVQWDAGRSIYNATGFGAQGGGGQVPQQQMPQGQAPVQQSPQQPQAPAQPQGSAAARYFSRVGAGAPAEQPPDASGMGSSFMAVKGAREAMGQPRPEADPAGSPRPRARWPEPNRRRQTGPATNAAKQPEPAAKPAARQPSAAETDREALRRAVGRVDSPDPKFGDDPAHPENVRRQLRAAAKVGSTSSVNQIATIALRMRVISEAEAARFREEAANAAKSRPRP